MTAGGKRKNPKISVQEALIHALMMIPSRFDVDLMLESARFWIEMRKNERGTIGRREGATGRAKRWG